MDHLGKFAASIFGFAVIILKIGKGKSSGDYLTLLAVALIGLILGIIALVRASNRDDLERKTSIGAVVLNLLIIIAMIGLPLFRYGSAGFAVFFAQKDYASDAVWEPHSSTAGKFNIKFPGRPLEKTETYSNSEWPTELYTAELKIGADGDCAVGYADFPADNPIKSYNEPEINTRLNVIMGEFAESSKGTILSTDTISLGLYPGLSAEVGYQMKGSEPTFRAIYRLYYTKERLYMLRLLGGVNNRLYENRDKFFNSFEITIKEDGLAKKKTANTANEFQLVKDIEEQAQYMASKADRPEHWQEVAQTWERAVKMMERIKPDNPKYESAQSLIKSFRYEIDLALSRAKSTQPKRSN